MKHSSIKQLALGGLFIALGIVLPFITGQIPQIGNMLLPMHLPVLLCGLICGYKYGLVVGFVLPFLRFVLFGMPPLFPTGIAMGFELAAYGAIIGIVYEKTNHRLYLSLILAMISGRIVWGIAQLFLLGASGTIFTWQLFIAGAFLNAIPGIILQFLLIPGLVFILNKNTKMKRKLDTLNNA